MPRKNSTHLTDTGIERISRAAPGKRIERFDAGAPGLALRVTDRGVKSWSAYFRLAGSHLRKTIGGWPEIGVAEARDSAREIKKQAAAGIDPRTVQQAEDAEARAQAESEAERLKAFGPLAEKYIERECPKLARGADIEAVIRREILPHWSDRPLAELRKRDAIALTDALVDVGRPAAAFKLYETIKRLGNWLVERDEIEVSPFASMKPPADKVTRDRDLKDHEIAALWLACDEMRYPFGPLLQLLLLTGQRRNEVAAMQLGELDLEKATWVIPGERSKNNLAHVVPLSGAAMSVIESLPRFDGPFVFTTTNGERPVSGFSKCKRRINALAGVADWRIHDLRRTCRTGLAGLGVPEIVCEKVLNHQPRGLVAVYNVYQYVDEKRDALARWARRIEEIVSPPPANVVSMAKRA